MKDVYPREHTLTKNLLFFLKENLNVDLRAFLKGIFGIFNEDFKCFFVILSLVKNYLKKIENFNEFEKVFFVRKFCSCGVKICMLKIKFLKKKAKK
jgi:hypothetical protein